MTDRDSLIRPIRLRRPSRPCRPRARRHGFAAATLATLALAAAPASAEADPPAALDFGLAGKTLAGGAVDGGLLGADGAARVFLTDAVVGRTGAAGNEAAADAPAEGDERLERATDDGVGEPQPEPDADARPSDGEGPPIDKDSERVLRIGTAEELIEMFRAMGFSYVDVRDADRQVPRLQIAAFPSDIDELNTLFLRKSAFFNTLLPIVLEVNEQILADRRRLLALRERLADGGPIGREEDRWLTDLSERYDIDDRDLDDLAIRVDAIPPSMALAMAAVESGWGTSSLAQEANALFGQITTSGSGIQAASGHTYATFDTLRDSVAAYARNLNTHAAYREFRAMRTAMRRAGQTPDGYRLMGELVHYSELGNQYIDYIRRVMRDDELHRIDDAVLVPAPTERPVERPS